MPNWTEDAPVADVPCPLCSEGVRRRIVDTVWDAPESSVYQCSACEIVFIDPIMTVEEEEAFYKAEFAGYMKQRGGAGETQAAEHFQKNRGEAERRLANLQPYLNRNMRVLEVGSSTGFLLHALAPYVTAVTGVEPGQAYANYANQLGIQIYPSLQAVIGQHFDLILGYYVLEHLRNPVEYLRQLRELLNPGGYLVLEVPNVDDALVRFYQLESFDRFYWQKAHYFNYSHKTLKWVLTKAKFQAETIPEHRYDISNHIHWLLTGQPGGKGKYGRVFDDALNREYVRCLKEQWLCDTVMAIATKQS